MSFVNQLNGVAKDENVVPESESGSVKPTTSSPKSDKSDRSSATTPAPIKVKKEIPGASTVNSGSGDGAKTTEAVPDDDTEMPSNEGTGASPAVRDKNAK